jgi:hypothetical protein
VAPRRDNKQWEDACREAGVVDDDAYAASDDFHDWLRDWKEGR